MGILSEGADGNVALDADADVQPDAVRRLRGVHEELAHVTVEVNRPQPARATA